MRAASSLSRPITRAFILFGVVLSLFFAVLAAVAINLLRHGYKLRH